MKQLFRITSIFILLSHPYCHSILTANKPLEVVSQADRLNKTGPHSSDKREAKKDTDRNTLLKTLLSETEMRLNLNDFQQAEKLLNRISDLFKGQDTTSLTARYYLLKAKYDKERNKLDLARREAERAFDLFLRFRDTAGMAGCYSQMGSIAWKKHDYSVAFAAFNKALELYNKINDNKGYGQTLINLGVVCIDRNQFKLAEQFFMKSLEHYKKLNDRGGEATAFHYLGVYHFRQGRMKEAEENYIKAWNDRLAAGDTTGAVNSLTNLIHVYRELRQPEKALEASEKAAGMARALGDSSLVANTYIQTGNALLQSNEFVKAHEFFLHALLSALSISDSAISSHAYAALGSLFYKIGDYKKSSSYFDKAVNILPEWAGADRKAYLLNQEGNALLAADNPSEALKSFLKAYETASSHNDHTSAALYLKNAGRASSIIGKPEDAIRFFDASLNTLRKTNDEKGSIAVWNEKGNLLAQMGKMKEATASFDTLIILARKYSDFPSLAMGLRKKADIMTQTNRTGQESLYIESLNIAEKTGNIEVLQPSVLALAGFYERQNNYRNALSLFHRYMDLHDSINARKEKQQILFSQINFEIRLRDEQLKKVTQKIESLEKEQALALIALSRQKKITALLVVVVLLSLIILILGYRQYKIKKKTAIILAEQNEIVRKTNRQLTESEENLRKINQTKDKFLSIIAHDIRNPLTGILGFTEIIERQSEKLSREELRQINSLIQQSGRQLYDLLENLLYWARSQTGSVPFVPKIIDISEIAEKNIKLAQVQAMMKNITVVNKIQPGTHVEADENMLMVIVRNLLSNALKFTKNGGTVEIDARLANDKLEVMVKDSGIGMRPEQLEKLFSDKNVVPSVGTRQEKGSGLGLILCKEFVEKHRGTISAQSEPGNGTIITFTLPRMNN